MFSGALLPKTAHFSQTCKACLTAREGLLQCSWRDVVACAEAQK